MIFCIELVSSAAASVTFLVRQHVFLGKTNGLLATFKFRIAAKPYNNFFGYAFLG